MASIDLTPFDEALRRQDEGIDVPVLSMDGKTPTGLSIRVAGPDSDRATQARQELQQELIAANRLAPLTPAETAAQGTRFLAKITLGWSPSVTMGGQELSYSEANAIRIYERFRFIRQQVDMAAGSRLAFMTALPSSSATPSESE